MSVKRAYEGGAVGPPPASRPRLDGPQQHVHHQQSPPQPPQQQQQHAAQFPPPMPQHPQQQWPYPYAPQPATAAPPMYSSPPDGYYGGYALPGSSSSTASSSASASTAAASGGAYYGGHYSPYGAPAPLPSSHPHQYPPAMYPGAPPPFQPSPYGAPAPHQQLQQQQAPPGAPGPQQHHHLPAGLPAPSQYYYHYDYRLPPAHQPMPMHQPPTSLAPAHPGVADVKFSHVSFLRREVAKIEKKMSDEKGFICKIQITFSDRAMVQDSQGVLRHGVGSGGVGRRPVTQQQLLLWAAYGVNVLYVLTHHFCSKWRRISPHSSLPNPTAGGPQHPLSEIECVRVAEYMLVKMENYVARHAKLRCHTTAEPILRDHKDMLLHNLLPASQKSSGAPILQDESGTYVLPEVDELKRVLDPEGAKSLDDDVVPSLWFLRAIDPAKVVERINAMRVAKVDVASHPHLPHQPLMHRHHNPPQPQPHPQPHPSHASPHPQSVASPPQSHGAHASPHPPSHGSPQRPEAQEQASPGGRESPAEQQAVAR